MDELLEKLLLDRPGGYKGKKTCGGKSKMSKPSAIFFFPTGRVRETAPHRHARQPLGQMAGRVCPQTLFQATGVETEIVIIKTTGDNMQQAPLSQIGGKGIFIKELEEALLDEHIDLAVHSVKDIPTETPAVSVFLQSAAAKTFAMPDMRQGSNFETSSRGARWHQQPSSQAQLLHCRPDLDIRELRGNVDTRLRKVDGGEYEAIVLAKAGLDRLGMGGPHQRVLSPEVCMPAVGQGAIAVETRLGDHAAEDFVAKLDDAETAPAIIAERALLAALQGGCQVPMGAWARIERGEMVLEACVTVGRRAATRSAALDRPRPNRARNWAQKWRAC